MNQQMNDHHQDLGFERRAERGMPSAPGTGGAHNDGNYSRGGVNTGDVIADSLRNQNKDAQADYRRQATYSHNRNASTGSDCPAIGSPEAATLPLAAEHESYTFTRDDHGRMHHAHHGHAGRDTAGMAAVGRLDAHDGNYNKHDQHREHELEQTIRDGGLGKHEEMPAGMAGRELHAHHGGHHHHGPEFRMQDESMQEDWTR